MNKSTAITSSLLAPCLHHRTNKTPPRLPNPRSAHPHISPSPYSTLLGHITATELRRKPSNDHRCNCGQHLQQAAIATRVDSELSFALARQPRIEYALVFHDRQRYARRTPQSTSYREPLPTAASHAHHPARMEEWHAREWEAPKPGVGRGDQAAGTAAAAARGRVEPDVQPGAERRQLSDLVQECRRLQREEGRLCAGCQGR